MTDRINRSFRLLRESWAILQQDRALLVFPLASGICTLLASGAFLIPIFLTSDLPAQMGSPGSGGGDSQSFSLLHYAALFLFYLVNYSIVVFFNTALVSCAGKRLRGEDPTARDGLAFARANLGRIVGWAAVAATVGTVLRMIEDRVGWLGQIVVGLIGVAWTLAATFVVPVLVFEGLGPIDALKRSGSLFREVWGETVAGNAGIGIAGFLLSLFGIVPILLGFLALPWGILVGFVVAIVYWIGLAVVQSALQAIYGTAVYEYAANGVVPPAFSPDLITNAYVPKR